MSNNVNLSKPEALFCIIASAIATSIIWIGCFGYIKATLNNNQEDTKWILRSTEVDEYGYGETNIGTSGLHVWETRPLLNNSGYVSSQIESAQTNWEVTIVADEVQQTEYLIFKDKETGNICAVERRKYEEEVPESEKFYLND